MEGTITLWVFGLLCFIVAFAKETASGAGITIPGPTTRGARLGVAGVGLLALALGAVVMPASTKPVVATATPTPAGVPPTANGTPVSGPTAAAPAGSVAAPPPATPSPAAPSPSASGAAVVWSGRIGIPLDGELDFDRTPPGPRSDSADAGVSSTEFTDTTAMLSDTISVAHDHFDVWTGPATPTAAACSDWATTHPNTEAIVSVGTLVCLKSPGGRTVLIKVDAITPANYTVDATVTVWSG
ncbi:hypothetical protein [Kitasatospora sp. LaBMicrA B282]|uniref:hypothetical protein n=1 Tax=Kitasatospora sp. LaBMicrA B282 TaxID=3420949 RepID=UPI003D14746B